MEDRLKAFCLVVEMKSFSKAAEAKLITKSAMSHLIKNLEDELGKSSSAGKGKLCIRHLPGVSSIPPQNRSSNNTRNWMMISMPSRRK
jgi:hypothetical protein